MACKAITSRFESYLGLNFPSSSVVERATVNRKAIGSSPIWEANNLNYY